jgi:hypothetical protein
VVDFALGMYMCFIFSLIARCCFQITILSLRAQAANFEVDWNLRAQFVIMAFAME